MSVYLGFDPPKLLTRDLSQFANFICDWQKKGIENKSITFT